MGTAAIISMSILQASTGIAQIVEGRTAEIQAKTQGEILAKEKAIQSRKLLGRQTMGFLKGGVGLTGTPQDVFAETEAFALEDIASIRNHYKNVGRQAKMQGVFQGLSNIAMAGISGISALKQPESRMFNLSGSRIGGEIDERFKLKTDSDFNNLGRL